MFFGTVFEALLEMKEVCMAIVHHAANFWTYIPWLSESYQLNTQGIHNTGESRYDTVEVSFLDLLHEELFIPPAAIAWNSQDCVEYVTESTMWFIRSMAHASRYLSPSRENINARRTQQGGGGSLAHSSSLNTQFTSYWAKEKSSPSRSHVQDGWSSLDMHSNSGLCSWPLRDRGRDRTLRSSLYQIESGKALVETAWSQQTSPMINTNGWGHIFKTCADVSPRVVMVLRSCRGNRDNNTHQDHMIFQADLDLSRYFRNPIFDLCMDEMTVEPDPECYELDKEGLEAYVVHSWRAYAPISSYLPPWVHSSSWHTGIGQRIRWDQDSIYDGMFGGLETKPNVDEYCFQDMHKIPASFAAVWLVRDEASNRQSSEMTRIPHAKRSVQCDKRPRSELQLATKTRRDQSASISMGKTYPKVEIIQASIDAETMLKTAAYYRGNGLSTRPTRRLLGESSTREHVTMNLGSVWRSLRYAFHQR